jgi:hypothetical protein
MGIKSKVKPTIRDRADVTKKLEPAFLAAENVFEEYLLADHNQLILKVFNNDDPICLRTAVESLITLSDTLKCDYIATLNSHYTLEQQDCTIYKHLTSVTEGDAAVCVQFLTLFLSIVQTSLKLLMLEEHHSLQNLILPV